MDVKYQVFVSSTYKDLAEERQEVMQALLELDCIPVGMELFPAADDDQWTLIKRLIDDCDYYILIVGGRYGSINEQGMSYTQMEYEYALSKDIPIISFLHKNPGQIPIEKSETNSGLISKLDEFKEFVQKKMCRFWTSPIDLGSQVSRSLVRLIKDKPRSGWVKASALPSQDATVEILELRKEIERLQYELLSSKNHAPEGAEKLSQGEDPITITFQYQGYNWEANPSTQVYKLELLTSWNKIFAEISPLMFDEASQNVIKEKIAEYILRIKKTEVSNTLKPEKRRLKNYSLLDNDFHTLIIQFRALGLISESVKKRSIHDKGTYWKLTPFGDTVMTRLRAIRKN
jgi:hypothetical protein